MLFNKAILILNSYQIHFSDGVLVLKSKKNSTNPFYLGGIMKYKFDRSRMKYKFPNCNI